MKLKKFFVGLLGVFALASCSSEKIMPDEPMLPEEELNTRFMTISIRNAEGLSRADETFEDGSDAESKIKTIRFYFFDKDGKAYRISYTGKNYYDCEEIEEDGTSGDPNVEKKLKAVIVLSSDNEKEDWSGIDKMIAIANFDDLELGETNMDLSSLKSKVDDYGFGYGLKPTEDDYFIMTSSSFGPKTPSEGEIEQYGCEVKVDSRKHIKTTREDAQNSPVDMYVERVVAKVRATTAWKEGMETKSVTYGGENYTAVQLMDKNYTTNKETALTTPDGEKNIYVIFTGWDLSGYTDQSFLFKQVNPSWTLGSWTWNDHNRYRSYWAMNAKDVKYLRHKHSDAVNKLGSKVGNTSTTGDALYCQENAADYTDDITTNPGTKRNYTPTAEVGNRTQAYFKAVLVTIDNNVATPLELAIWGDVKYTMTDLPNAMLNSVGDIIYTTNDDDPTGERAKLTPDQVKLMHAENVVDEFDIKEESDMDDDLILSYKADNKTEASRRYLTYIQLDESKLDKIKLYKKEIGADNQYVYTPISRIEANSILSNMPGARCWEGGDTYYYVDIRHLNRADDMETMGMYGIVRNHVYDIEINSVYGLGTPVFTPDSDIPYIIPQKPSNEAFYLGARLNILSWRVVSQGVSLDW